MKPLTTWPRKKRGTDFGPKIQEALRKHGKAMNAKQIDTAIGGASDIHSVLSRLEHKGAVKNLGKFNNMTQWGMEGMKLDSTLPATMACRDCREVLPYDEKHFCKDVRAASGLKNICRPCNRARQRGYGKAKRTEERQAKAQMPEPPSGRFKETKTATGKIVQAGRDWKPHRDGRRYNVPGLMGYQSSLARL